MRTLPSTLEVARNLLSSEQGWLTFLEIELKSGLYIRLVDNSRHVRADGRIWQAASFKVSPPPEQSDGQLGEMTLAVSNVSREPLRLVEQDDDVLGCEMTAWHQHTSSLDSFTEDLSWHHDILDSEIDERTALFVAGHASNTLRTPARLATRDQFPGLLPQRGTVV